MSNYTLRLIEDKLAPDSLRTELPGEIRTLYVVRGEVTVQAGGETRRVGTDEGWFGTGPCLVEGGANGATVWRWELAKSPNTDDGVASGAGVESVAKLSEELLVDPAGKHMMRCDRVDFPLGGVAYTHIHWGPGIRCLLRGELLVRTEESEFVVHPGETWFERGPDVIYAEASKTEETSFIRAMVLPRVLKGQTSIRYVNEEDEDKPKTQHYTRYVDEFVEL